MKCGVVVFPGSNCDEDLFHVLSEGLGLETVKIWHKEHELHDCDVIFLPGGFSYGDYLRSGAVARFSNIMEQVISFANKGGKVIGICNGFQILTESGLLPGALLGNAGQKFICKNLNITPQNPRGNLIQGKAYNIPIAHAEGRYYAPANDIKELEANNQVLFRYCNSTGEITDAANPNGSINNIAGITNKAGNVIGMMPHPERAASSILGNQDGTAVLESILDIALASR